MLDLGSAVGYLMLDTSNFKKGFSSALDDLKVFNGSTATSTDKMKALSSAMTSTGTSLTKNVTLPLVGVGTAIMAVGNKFEAQMSRVQAISGATQSEFEQLEEQAIQLGASTSFSATEAAQGMEELASAGFSTQEIMAAMPGLLDLAASSGADLATASGIAAAAINGFGLEASEAGHVADVFAEAAARTNAQTEDMGEAMKYIAPVAHAMGQSLEETAAAIGIMSDAGIMGSQAGTTLRGALSRLAKPTDGMVQKMEELGVSFYDAQGNMLPLNQIISTLQDSFQGLTQEQRNNALVTLFGQESLSGMLALIQAGPEELVALTNELKNADGSAQAMADTMLDNTSGAIEEMMGSIETLAIRLQQVLAPAITNIVQHITDFVNWLSQLDEDTLKVITAMAGFAAAIGPVLLIGGKIVGVISSILSFGGKIAAFVAQAGGIGAVLSSVGSAIASVAVPVGAAIAAIAALYAAWQTNFAGIRDYAQQAFSAIQSIIESVIGFIQGIIEAGLGVIRAAWENNFLGIQEAVTFFAELIRGTFENLFAIISGVLTSISQILQGDFSGAWQTIQTMFSTIITNIQTSLSNFGTWVSTVWTQIWTAVSTFFSNIWNNIVTFFSNIITNIINFFTVTLPAGIQAGIAWLATVPEQVAAFLSQLPERIGYIIGLALGTFTRWVADMIAKAIEVGQNVLNNIVNFFQQLPTNIANFISTALNSFTSWVSNMISKAQETGSNVLSNIVNFFQQLPSNISNFISQALSNFSQWASDMWNKAKEAAQNVFDAIVDGLSDLPGRVLEIGSNVVSGLWEGIQSGLGWIKDKITGFCSSIVDGFMAGFGAHSPARKLMPVGGYVVQGLEVGMENLARSAQDTIGNITQGMVDKATSVAESMSFLSGAGAEDSEALKSIQNQVTWYSRLADSIYACVDAMRLMNQGQITDSLPVYPTVNTETGISNDQIATLANAIVNAMSISNIGALSGDLNISIPINGTEFYRATLKDFRRVQKANPEIM